MLPAYFVGMKDGKYVVMCLSDNHIVFTGTKQECLDKALVMNAKLIGEPLFNPGKPSAFTQLYEKRRKS